MSSKVKKIAKKLAENLMFPLNMYSNMYGSYIIASYILNGKGDVKTINKEWKRLERLGDVYVNDKDWLKTLCSRFGVEYDLTGRIVMVAGRNNICCLVADEDGLIYPIREDQQYPAHSLSEALEDKTIYRIVSDKGTDGSEPIENAKVAVVVGKENR